MERQDANEDFLKRLRGGLDEDTGAEGAAEESLPHPGAESSEDVEFKLAPLSRALDVGRPEDMDTFRHATMACAEKDMSEPQEEPEPQAPSQQDKSPNPELSVSSRLRGVAVVKNSLVYALYRGPRLLSPDPLDRSVSKRRWESQMSSWRRAMRTWHMCEWHMCDYADDNEGEYTILMATESSGESSGSSLPPSQESNENQSFSQDVVDMMRIATLCHRVGVGNID